MKTPSLLRVVQNDPFSLCVSIVLATSMAFYAWGVIADAGYLDVLFWVTMPFAASSLIGLAWRYKFIASVFEDGLETTAVIKEIGFFRASAHIRYAYEHNGQKFAAFSFMVSNSRTQSLAAGQTIQIVVHRANPRVSFPKELFI